MPRLPDDTVLGQLPSGRSGRILVTYDTTAPGRAMQEMGQGIANLGKGIAGGLQGIAARQDEKAAEDELKARSGYLTEKVKLDEERDNERDPEKLQAFPQRYQELANRYGQQIPDGKRRERWQLDMAPKVEAEGVKTRTQIFGIERDKAYAEANEQLDLMRKIGADPKTSEEDRQAALETGNNYITYLEQKGFLNAEEAGKRRKGWVESYTWDRLAAMEPAQRAYAIGGIEGALIARESGGRPGVMNDWGFVGLYQFGAPRLAAMGIYTPGSGEDMARWNKSEATAPGKWSGTFNIPGFPQVKTVQDFRANPDAQRKAYEIHDQLMEREIQSRGLDAYIGQTVGGVLITRDGLKAMIHLGGAGGTKRALDSGGRDQSPDANGTKVLNYAAMASKGTTGIAKILPADRQEQLKQFTYKELAQQKDNDDKRLKEEQARISTDIAQDIASMEKTGIGREGLTREKVVEVLGDEMATEWERQRERAWKFHETFRNSDTQSMEEIGRRVDTLAPQGGAPDFKEQDKVYERARQKEKAIREERETDPAMAVERHPAVQVVRDAAEYTQDASGARRLTPNSAMSIVAARLEAQRQLGIVEPSPITRPEGAVIARQLRMIGDENQKGIQRLMRQLDETYGEFAPLVLQAALVQEKVNRDLATLATDFLAAVAKERAVPVPMVQQLSTAIDNQVVTDAFNGVAPQAAPPVPSTNVGGFAPQQYKNMPTKQRQLMLQNATDPARQQAEMTAKQNAEPALTYDPADIKWLHQNRGNPDAVFQFNAKYQALGKNPAEMILKEIDRRLTAGKQQ